MKTITILIATLLSAASLFAQQEGGGRTFLTAEAAGGFGRYITDMDVQGLERGGFEGMLRVMWNPEHLLSLGLETGYQHLYSIDESGVPTEFGPTDVTVDMTSVPVTIAFAMKVNEAVKLRAGTGIYLLTNSGKAFGEAIDNSAISIGLNVGASYAVPVSESLSIGGEVRYSYISKLQDSVFGIQFLLVYDLLDL